MTLGPHQTRPYGRSLSHFLDKDGNLLPAEQKLLAAVTKGEICNIAEERPESATPEKIVRAQFLRFLALGGDDNYPLHENGVRLRGAWIIDLLELDFCALPAPLELDDCHLEQIDAVGTSLPMLNLNGSRLANGLNAEAITVTGNIFLKNGFTAKGEVCLLGASIGGDLSCRGGAFNPETDMALDCNRAEIKGSLFIDNGFTATGEVRLIGARIGCDLCCGGGTFRSKAGKALSCDNASIKGGMFFRLRKDPETRLSKPFSTSGIVSLSGATLGTLIDDKLSWPKVGDLILDGFRIGGFAGEAPTSGHARVAWLLRQCKDHLISDFKSQPWEETIRVLREMGHDEDAKIVAIAKQDQLREAGRHKGLARDVHWMWGALAGYGYRPLRLLACMVVIWLACAGFFAVGAQHGLFAPTSPVVHTNPDIRQQCAPNSWTTCNLPDEYTTFSPLYYSLDLILPVVDLQQEKDWAPVVTRDGDKIKAGEGLRWLMWFEIIAGWLGSLFLIAIFTNLVKKD